MKHEAEGFQPFRRETMLPAGNLFKRAAAARAIASLRRCPVVDVVSELWPSDRVLLQMVSRAAVAPATTFTTGWAAELAQRRVADTLEALGAVSGAADVMKAALVLDWDGAGVIGAPGFVASANHASFVKEGDPIPVRQLASAPADLLPYKLATIAVLSREMVEGSNAEVLIADALVRACGLALDAVFFGSAAAVTNTQPAGIRNGIAAITASSNTDFNEAFAEDFAALIGAVSTVGGKGPYIIVANAGRVATMIVHHVYTPNPNFILVPAAVGNDIIAIAPGALVAALSAEPEVETANAATLVMDTAPVTPNTTQPTRSLFQSDSLGVKVRWPVSWALRNSGAVAWVTPAWK